MQPVRRNAFPVPRGKEKQMAKPGGTVWRGKYRQVRKQHKAVINVLAAKKRNCKCCHVWESAEKPAGTALEGICEQAWHKSGSSQQKSVSDLAKKYV